MSLLFIEANKYSFKVGSCYLGNRGFAQLLAKRKLKFNYLLTTFIIKWCWAKPLFVRNRGSNIIETKQVYAQFWAFLLVLFSIYSEMVSSSCYSEPWWKGKLLGHRGSRARGPIIQRKSVFCQVNPTEIEHKFTFHKVGHLQSPKVKSTLPSTCDLKCAMIPNHVSPQFQNNRGACQHLKSL